MSRPQHGGRQQPDIGQHREAAADAGIVIEHARSGAAASRSRRPLRLAGPGRLADAEEMRRADRARPPSRASSAAMVCISVSPVPPDFEIATKRVVASGSRCEQRAVGVGIEIVHEMQARPVAQARRRRARRGRQAAPASGRRGSIRRCRERRCRSRRRAAARRRRGSRRGRRASPAAAAAAARRRHGARASQSSASPVRASTSAKPARAARVRSIA